MTKGRKRKKYQLFNYLLIPQGTNTRRKEEKARRGGNHSDHSDLISIGTATTRRRAKNEKGKETSRSETKTLNIGDSEIKKLGG